MKNHQYFMILTAIFSVGVASAIYWQSSVVFGFFSLIYCLLAMLSYMKESHE